MITSALQELLKLNCAVLENSSKTLENNSVFLFRSKVNYPVGLISSCKVKQRSSEFCILNLLTEQGQIKLNRPD